MTITLKSKRYLPWLFGALAIMSLGITAILHDSIEAGWHVALALIGSSAAFVHFLYHRHLEETRLFHELFTTFNKRYDCLNGTLNDLHSNPADQEYTPKEKNALYDYFNLCAEEYYFYCAGYIPEEVWSAWKSGIRYYLGRNQTEDLLAHELKGGSYYGLTIEEIYRG